MLVNNFVFNIHPRVLRCCRIECLLTTIYLSMCFEVLCLYSTGDFLSTYIERLISVITWKIWKVWDCYVKIWCVHLNWCYIYMHAISIITWQSWQLFLVYIKLLKPLHTIYKGVQFWVQFSCLYQISGLLFSVLPITDITISCAWLYRPIHCNACETIKLCMATIASNFFYKVNCFVYSSIHWGTHLKIEGLLQMKNSLHIREVLW